MITTEKDWFVIDNVNEIDSPALLIFPARVKENIRLLTARVKDITSLRPHVKTNKIAEVCRLMLDAGICKFKCATIAEAEMLGMTGVPDVLLAYQPVGPKIDRLIKLVKAYPSTLFSCLTDDQKNVAIINEQCIAAGIQLNIFIDVNVGMNRTGIQPGEAYNLFQYCHDLSNIEPVGLHGYDGHVNDTDILLRQQNSDAAFSVTERIADKIKAVYNLAPVIVTSGSPSFATHILRQHVEYSPGTFVFWDWGYKQLLPAEPYQLAALVLSRVIAVVDAETICTDLGHKSVAAENPLPRVHFLNAPDSIPVGQSEEHLVLKVPDSSNFAVGDVLYGVPVHICPTVALYDEAVTVEGNIATGSWQVIARKRKITI